MLRELLGLRPSTNRLLRRSSRKMSKALTRSGLLWKRETPCYGVAQFPVKNLCMVGFYGLARPDRICLWSGLPLNIDRDRCSRELLMVLLRRNSNQDIGKYALQDTAQGLAIVQNEVCSATRSSVTEVAGVINQLLVQTQDLVFQLYAEGMLRRISDWEDDYRASY